MRCATATGRLATAVAIFPDKSGRQQRTQTGYPLQNATHCHSFMPYNPSYPIYLPADQCSRKFIFYLLLCCLLYQGIRSAPAV